MAHYGDAARESISTAGPWKDPVPRVEQRIGERLQIIFEKAHEVRSRVIAIREQVVRPHPEKAELGRADRPPSGHITSTLDDIDAALDEAIRIANIAQEAL